MSFMSTRRSAKPVKKRLGSIQEELQKSFPTVDTLPEKTPDHLEPENAAQKRHSEENVHDELQRSVKTPSNLQREVAFCPPRRRRAPLLRCNMSDLKSVYNFHGDCPFSLHAALGIHTFSCQSTTIEVACRASSYTYVVFDAILLTVLLSTSAMPSNHSPRIFCSMASIC